MDKLDNFFKERLKELEIAPSERARSLFLEKIEEKNKKKFIVFSKTKRLFFGAAAAMLLFGFVGFHFYLSPVKNKFSGNKEKSDGNKNSIVNAVKVEAKRALVSKFSNMEVTSKTPLNQINLETTVKYEDFKVVNNSTLAQNIPTIFDEIANQDAIIDERKSSDISALKSKDYLPKNAFFETIVYISPLQEEEIAAVTLSSEIKTNESVEGINSDNDSSDKTLFAKVVDEIRHIKNGEKVEFNKLGFKPVDELSLNQEGFIASETRQIKETYSWIKSKITNN